MENRANDTNLMSLNVWARDLLSGLVVFLVAIPLCLGIALASGAPLFSGILAGIVGGLVIGILSGSHTSVSGPAAGLTAVVASQIGALGSFQAFLLAVVVGGLIQIVLGLARAGFIAAFFPSSVIKGLLAAIGVILIIKQTPYMLGLAKAVSSSSESAPVSHPNVFTQIAEMFSGDPNLVAMNIGICSMFFLLAWDRIPRLKKSLIPAPLIVVAIGIFVEWTLTSGGGEGVGAARLVKVPIIGSFREVSAFLTLPDFGQIANAQIYLAGLTLAIVASLETLLNLEAVDNLDRKQRVSPPNRELFAQGVGNVVSGLVGGLPVTSVVIRGTVNVGAGSESKLSAIFHGLYLAAAVFFLPTLLNLIPLSSLAAVLLVTGFKLASPKLMMQLWSQGRSQFIPFIITLIAIVGTDLLIGIMVGLSVALTFILYSNYKRPVQMIVEKHLGGELYHLQLANQVSFLNRAALDRTLNAIPKGAHVLIDASTTAYIDPDILSLVKDYQKKIAPAREVEVSLRGFQPAYEMHDSIQYVDFSTREMRQSLTPAKVLKVLADGNQRFRNQHPLPRDIVRQISATAAGHYPMAVLLSCMDARTPTELIFDQGLGDIMNICLAGNVMVGPRVLASVEYGCVNAGAKLVMIMAHTGSTVLRSIIDHACGIHEGRTGEHFQFLVDSVNKSISLQERQDYLRYSQEERASFCDEVARRHVINSIESIRAGSHTMAELIDRGEVGMIASMYNTLTGTIEFMNDSAVGFDPTEASTTEATARRETRSA